MAENLTPKTIKSYTKAALGIERLARKELATKYRDVDINTMLTPSQILVWFQAETRGERYERASVRHMRSALRYWFAEVLPQEFPALSEEAIKCAESVTHIKKPRHVRKKTGDNMKTSARKAKSISIADWRTLRSFLATRGNIMDSTLIMWIECAMLTGLRPCEWETASIRVIDDKLCLWVRNAKNTHGRSHGEHRTVRLDHMSSSDINMLEAFLEYVQKTSEIPFETLNKRCQVYLNYANRDCWPRRKRSTVCLYTGRHQFAANAKASGNDDKVIAAYMGHAVDATADTHYARAGSANLEMPLVPVQAEVDRIRHTKSEFKDRVAHFKRRTDSGEKK